MIKLGHLKSFLVCFVPLCAVFLLVVGFLAWDGANVRAKKIADDQSFALDKSIAVLRERINVVVSDLLILSESTQLDAVIEGRSSVDQLAREYELFSLRRGIYDQIRYLDNAGMEMVRVNYGSGIPYAVSTRELQDKHERSYFKLAASAPRGTFYMSGIDLNREFGEIERPIKPVIRLASPVFDRFGDRQGVLVLNLRAAPMLDEVITSLAREGGRAFITDAEGNWILGGEPGENWASDLTDTAATLSDRYGDAWQRMSIGETSFVTDTGFYSVEQIGVSDLLLNGDGTKSLSVILENNADFASRLNLFVGVRLPSVEYDALLSPDRSMLMVVSIAVIILIAIGSAAYSWTRRRQLVASFGARLSERVLEVSKNSVVITDQDGIIRKVNPGFTAMTGYLPNEAVGKPLAFVRAERENTEELDEILMSARASGIWEGEVRNRRKDGKFFYSNVVISAISEPEDGSVHYVEMGLDISRHMENAQELWRQANHDALTGLPNRLLFEDRLEVACGHAESEDYTIALLYIDLDGFKPINDRHGHEIGDKVLRLVGEQIKEIVRQDDTVARLGGDEFAVIAEDVKGPDEADRIAQKIQAAIQRPMQIGSLSISVGASVGIAIFPTDSHESVALLGLADEQMYRQKRFRKGNEKKQANGSR
ncbi:diguanylate cyclase domain-containing protein [Thalassospira tepidiphila]|uniref:diguanylate cyclase domain-containing protein n=1 Tax=Thalassospira tepidiphila TaxID=393657 RepID=UPI003AA94D23